MAALVSGALFLIRKILETTEQRYFASMFEHARISLYENGARMDELVISGHAFKHGLAAEDIFHAWNHYFVAQCRCAPNEDQIVAVGPTRDGRVAELVGSQKATCLVIYHAMVPPTRKVLLELGLARRS